MAETRTRRNIHDVTWAYANKCWAALRSGEPFPPLANYQVYETTEGSAEKLVKQIPIEPMKITYNGVTYFG